MERPSHLASIGASIRKIREQRGLSQDQVAELAALRRATVTDIENGKMNFEINTLVRIASALNCYLDVVLSPAD